MIKTSFQVNNIPLNWGTLLIGWKGPGHYQKQLTLEEIQKFAEKRLENASIKDPDNPLIAELLTLTTNQANDLESILTQLAKQQGVDLNLELRKWRCVLLKELLRKLDKSNDYVQGLIDLTDFWSMFDFPNDSPHVIQGKGNHHCATEYYTNDNFLKALEKHKQWLLKELITLQEKM